ncbi:surface protein PspC [Echinococcus multilocularis]|uniref:Surface protein PspC n=1 Tax=Echinococcus multilocularis TaxID=6211 RepID=A0A068Y6S0_ECHMU|nr:surface protein PspC [Echinococcus multilocularis]
MTCYDYVEGAVGGPYKFEMTTTTGQRGLSDISGNVEELRKSLPHVDLETGLKNRVVKRDPIAGLGDLPKEHCDFGKPKTAHQNKKNFNKTLLSWDADTAAPLSKTGKNPTKGDSNLARNPIALTGNLGEEVDSLRCTSRPRKSSTRGPQRDPISGKGDFGEREWDPIWKYNGRARRARSSTAVRCNPLTGENAKTFAITVEERQSGCLTPKTPRSTRNVITGENCTNFDISQEMKPCGPRRHSEVGKNTITGENCSTYDVNIENSKTGRARVRARSESKRINPLTGENVTAFTISKEEKKRATKPYVYSNTVTGENRPSYKITPIERNVTARPNTAPSNPLLGENTQHYKYRVGEKEKTTKTRDISSPLTGEGSRGSTYSISVEERRRKPANTNNSRNVLTGENCNTYQICQEMRSERKSSAPPTSRGGSGGTYNILTGAVC